MIYLPIKAQNKSKKNTTGWQEQKDKEVCSSLLQLSRNKK